MINKELEMTINNQKILDRLAENLGIRGITESSSIKKIANAFEVELSNYSSAVDTAIANNFLSTMDRDLFINFAADYGIYRKVYSKVSLRPVDMTATLTINTDTVFAELPKNSIVFRKGDVLYGTETFSIKVAEDVIFESMSSTVTPHLTITLNGEEGFTINEGSTYYINTSQKDVALYVPEFILTFKNTVGLVRAEEDFDDFRLRVYEATYLSNNMANSLITSITKEVPSISYIETAEIDQGRAVEYLYPYTVDLLQNGFDDTLNTYVIPMIETALSNKVVYSNMLKVAAPKALTITARVRKKTSSYITASLLEEVSREFNLAYFKTPSITVKQIKETLVSMLSNYNITSNDISVIFIDPLLGEDVLNLNDSEIITINTGRFLHLATIEEVISE